MRWKDELSSSCRRHHYLNGKRSAGVVGPVGSVQLVGLVGCARMHAGLQQCCLGPCRLPDQSEFGARISESRFVPCEALLPNRFSGPVDAVIWYGFKFGRSHAAAEVVQLDHHLNQGENAQVEQIGDKSSCQTVC
jgi:hypothetical protein